MQTKITGNKNSCSFLKVSVKLHLLHKVEDRETFEKLQYEEAAAIAKKRTAQISVNSFQNQLHSIGVNVDNYCQCLPDFN